MTFRILTAAIGGALLLYGVLSDHPEKPGERWLGIGIGGLLILSAFLS